MSRYRYADEGSIGGVRHVTVLDRGGNPQEYNIPIDEARLRYPESPRIKIAKDTSVGDDYSWYYTVEHMPIDLDAGSMEYGRVESFAMALDYAITAALYPEDFDHHGCQCIAVAAAYREAQVA